ncbi:hypothetical protein [Nonlabens ulvanivorans]|uniref:hypothetical protein n=1 Tax=Nonlabens ulvanivorans TaxID=906888 RepID=UPI0037CA08A2
MTNFFYSHRLVLAICIFISPLYVLSQTPSNASQGVDPYGLPQIIPPAPTLANLMTFSEVPVDNSTGKPSISLPILQRSLGSNLSLSLLLNYDSAGIKPDNRSGWTGTGWNLTGLASISRTVVGKPDEHKQGVLAQYNYTMHGNYQTSVFSSGMTSDEKNAFYWEASRGNMDTEFDIFQYSILGSSGRFIILLDSSNVPFVKMIGESTNDEIDIITSSNNNTAVGGFNIDGFIVTDTNGNTFTFMQKETSIAYREFDDPNGTLQEDPIGYTSSWMLSDIKNNADLILATFFYDHNMPGPYEEEYYTPYRYESNNVKQAIAGSNASNFTEVLPKAIFSTRQRIVSEVMRVSKISLRNEEVLFHSNMTGQPEYISNKGFVLNEIEVKEINNASKIEKIQFDYLIINNRLILDEFLKVSNGNSGAIKYQPYLLEYNGVIPEINTTSTDYFGYYNAPTSGLGLSHSLSQMLVNSNRYTNPNTCYKGVLKSITYPTGGKKEFEFESNTFSYINDSLIDLEEIPQNTISKELVLNPVGSQGTYELGIFYFDPIGTSDVKLSMTAILPQNNDLVRDARLVFKKVEPIVSSPNQISNNYGPNFPIYDPIDFDLNSNFSKHLQITGNNTSALRHDFLFGYYQVEFQFNSSGTLYPNDQNQIWNIKINKKVFEQNQKFMYGGGVRIKSVIFSNSNNTQSTKWNYNYNNFSDEPQLFSSIISSGSTTNNFKIFPEIMLLQRVVHYDNCLSGGTVMYDCEINQSFVVEKRSSQSPLVFVNGSHVLYKNVEVIKTDLNGNALGKERNVYTSLQDFPIEYSENINPYVPAENKDYLYGKLIKQQSFDSNDILAVQTENFYIVNELPIYDSIVIRAANDACGWSLQYSSYDDYVSYIQSVIAGSSDSYYCQEQYDKTNGYGSNPNADFYSSLFKSASYKVYQGKLNLVQSSLKSFFHDSQNNQNELTTTTDYTYNTSNHKVSEVRVADSKGDVIISKAFYVDDLSASSIKTTLKSHNMITTPLRKETYLNGKLINQVLSEYREETHNSIDVPYLDKVYSSKGDEDLELRLTYHHYDDYGNILDVSKKDGTHVSYIWGHNKTLPIAKIEGLTYQQVADRLTGGDLIALDNFDEGDLATIDSLRYSFTVEDPFMVTTYVYEVGIGIKEVTDPRGRKMTYFYDDFNRLKYVEDHDGNRLSENEYKYATQN